MNSSTGVSRKRFKLCKKLLSGTYTFVPETASGGTDYFMDVKPRTNTEMPFMFLFEGKGVPDAKVEGEEWITMQREGRKEGAWTLFISDTSGTKEVAWKGTVDVAVDGISAGLSRPGYKLIDMCKGESDEVLAVFTPKKGLSKGGVLQLNVNWGEEFERMVILTFMCLYDRISTQATDVIGRGAAGSF